MDEAIIARWNETVAPRDTVWHLGDFCFRNGREAPWYLERLNGEIHLIEGNHDRHTLKHHSARFASVSVMKEIRLDGQAIVLCHYPMREWDGCYRGSWHLFGHVHGRLGDQPLGYSLDVGVDANRFYPWSLADIGQIFASRDRHFR